MTDSSRVIEKRAAAIPAETRPGTPHGALEVSVVSRGSLRTALRASSRLYGVPTAALIL